MIGFVATSREDGIMSDASHATDLTWSTMSGSVAYTLP